jgi:CubicO group peptidase (beta-lactamase class C family)
MKRFFIAAATLLAVTGAVQAQEADAARHIRHVEAGLLGRIAPEGDAGHSLAERMAALTVAGVSIAVVHQGKLEWAKAYGEAWPGIPVTTQTMFQAGSISKPVAAMAALRLVEQGKLSLDTDINTFLKSWKLPAAVPAKGKSVTLRHLLTHTGGLTVHGFPGYASGQPVPSVPQVLDGIAPANTEPVRIDTEPGTLSRYSGGGYTIAQLAMTDVTGQSFPDLMRVSVLAPLGMTRSTYEQPLPIAFADAAIPYDEDGKPLKDGAHVYPEMAAAGLWTTPSDLARYVIEVQNALKGETGRVLSQAMTRQMLTRDMDDAGLGPQIAGAVNNPTFGHGGVNYGFQSSFVAYAGNGDGVIVMTNSDNGGALANEIVRAVAEEYAWPDNRAARKHTVPVDAAVLAPYAGHYRLSADRNATFHVENGVLVGQITGFPPFVRLAATQNRFLPEPFEAQVEFFKPAGGAPAYLLMHQNGGITKAPKIAS